MDCRWGAGRPRGHVRPITDRAQSGRESRLARTVRAKTIMAMRTDFRRGRLALVVAIGLTTLLSGPAATAHAGTYTVSTCRTADGGSAGDSGWAWEARVPSLTMFPARGCPGGVMKLELAPATPHPANDYARVNFWPAPDTTIRGYSLWRSVELAPEYDTVRYHFTNGKWVIVSNCKGCAIGVTTDPSNQANLVTVDGLSGVTGLSLLISCGQDDASTTACQVADPAARLQLYRADVVLEDTSAPAFAATPSGPLVSGARLTGVATATLSATDRGGGVFRAMAELDGEVVSTSVLDANGGACQVPFVVVQPCKTEASGNIGVDTTLLADGEHVLRFIVTDATGTNSAASRAVRIVTANGSCNPAPASSSARLSASLLSVPSNRHTPAAAKPRRLLTTAFRHPPNIVGRLLTAASAPVASSAICVEAAPAVDGASFKRIGGVATDASGGFSFRLPPGPSRRIHLVYRAPDGAVVATLMAQTRAMVTLRRSRRALRNGQVLVLRGRLAHGPFPRRGVLVEFQAKRGSRWQTFGTRRTAGNGRLSFRYRFTRTFGVRRYSLRARVPTQPGYPYTTAASRPVSVRVRG